MSAQYQAVSAEDSRLDYFAPIRKQSHSRCWMLSLGTLSVANFVMLLASLYFWRAAEHAGSAVPDLSMTTLGLTSEVAAVDVEIPDSLARVGTLSTAYVAFHWNTPWGAPNATDADSLWDNINTAHGHIAVDRTWAAENNVCYFKSDFGGILLTKLDVDSGLNLWIFLETLIKGCIYCNPITSSTAL